MLTDVICEDDRWEAAGLETYAERAARAALSHLGYDAGAFEIAVLGCNDARIAALNGDFREKQQPTNVLSWPSEERGAYSGEIPEAPEPGELGDIAIAFETCVSEAADAGKPIAEHMTHLLVHATLHLLGYDHIDEKDAVLMEGLETKILGNLGIADPYTI